MSSTWRRTRRRCSLRPHEPWSPGGRLALADIVSEKPLTEAITCDAELWASCIGGATQVDAYLGAIEDAGLRVTEVRDNTAYRFLSDSAQGATRTYGIKSISLLAVKAG